MNIVERILAENRGREGRVALVEDSRSMTYAELFAAVASWRRRLEAAGVRPGERVGFVCADSSDYVCLALAILSAGAAMVPISPSLSLNEVAPALDATDAHWRLADVAVAPDRPDALFLEDPLTRRRFRLERRAATGDRDAVFARLEPAFVRFSSGTTGASKGVVLSHAAILERTDAADRVLRITAEDRVLWVLSMSFHFVVTILLFLRRGACLVLCGEDFPGRFLRHLAAGEGTFLYASPFHYDLLAGSAAAEARFFRAVRMAISTAMPLSSDLAARFEARFSLPLCQAYGIIEVGLPFIQAPDEPRKPGSVGRLGNDYELRLLAPDDAGVGEVLLRGKGLFCAYFSPWRPRLDIDPEGWFHTGDLGRLDAEGHLFLLGRARAVINFAGMKVFPAQVEAVLDRHPQVRESRVFGEPHPRFGQWPVAQIVPRVAEFDERALRRYCYAHLPPYQVPKRFEAVAEIQKTASGKVRRAP